jgi:hypothetical protein
MNNLAFVEQRADSVLPGFLHSHKEGGALHFVNGERKPEHEAAPRNLITTRNLIRW